MRPSEIRDHILHDHEALRARLDAIEERLGHIEACGAQEALALRLLGIELLRALETHMAWEDRFLVPALREADAWGPERAGRLAEEHVEQREILGFELDALLDSKRPAALVMKGLADFARLLREDMEEEESFFLDPKVLRDDVIAVDAESG